MKPPSLKRTYNKIKLLIEEDEFIEKNRKLFLRIMAMGIVFGSYP